MSSAGRSAGRPSPSLRRLDALDRRHVERRRQVVEHRVEQRLDALVLEARSAQDRRHLDVERRLAKGLLDAIGRDLLLGEVGLHQLVVVVGAGLDQVSAGLVRGIGQLGRDLLLLPLGAQLVLPDQRPVADQVHDADEVGLLADRKLDRQRMRAKPVPHRVDRVVEVGAGAVHLVDVGDARHPVLVGLAPDRLGLRLDPGDGVEERDRAVQHPQRALDLDREVHVTGRVDDVDAVVLPGAGRGGGGDRDPPLLLLLHPVHDGSALVDLAHLVGAAREVEDPLRGRRLTGVDVRHDADVAELGKFDRAWHKRSGSLEGLWSEVWAVGWSPGAKKEPFRARVLQSCPGCGLIVPRPPWFDNGPSGAFADRAEGSAACFDAPRGRRTMLAEA